jgi:hypothetical protein
MGIFSAIKSRREAAAAERAEAERQRAEQRAAADRESQMSVDELLEAWSSTIAGAGARPENPRALLDGAGGSIIRPISMSEDISNAFTSVQTGFVMVTQNGDLVFAFRDSVDDPGEVEVIVRKQSEVYEPRKKEDREFIIVFEGDRLYSDRGEDPFRGDAWCIRTPTPDTTKAVLEQAGIRWRI